MLLKLPLRWFIYVQSHLQEHVRIDVHVPMQVSIQICVRICVLQSLLKRSLIAQLNNFAETFVLKPRKKEVGRGICKVNSMSLRHAFHQLTVAASYYWMFKATQGSYSWGRRQERGGQCEAYGPSINCHFSSSYILFVLQRGSKEDWRFHSNVSGKLLAKPSRPEGRTRIQHR